MKFVVAIQLVPDLVEELVIASNAPTLDPDTVRWVVNEFDDYAIEQAILLKERYGGSVTVVAPALEGADDALFSAAARGADVLVKLEGNFEGGFNNHALGRAFAPVVKALQPDLVLTGVQAHHQNDGTLGPLLAEELGLPYVGYVAGVKVENGGAVVRKEYPGGLAAEMEASLPAVLGIQMPDTPPRYVPISKIRQAMKTSNIQEQDAGELDGAGGLPASRMFVPKSTGRATMIEGDVDQVAARLVALFKEQGLL
jgi:electron transfer flavoprotein beta subunit